MDSGIRDIKGPLDLNNYLPLYIAAGILVLIILIALVLWYRKRNKVRIAPVIPKRPSDETALEALEMLQKKDLVRSGEFHAYYFELSNIVRHYLEDRFSLRAPEMTTEEFLSDMERTDLLVHEHKVLLKNFLSHCDIVKFAKHVPGIKEAESSYESAKKLVKQTREVREK